MPGVAAVLFTDVGRDGLLKGCNVRATVQLARGHPAAGDRQRRGRRAGRHRRSGAPRQRRHRRRDLRRALYEGRLDLRKALRLARDEEI
jgi:phosphoribosylformimino-5-aminoimidazole carboxamide ribotide isomerase